MAYVVLIWSPDDDAERRQEIDKHKDESVSKAKNGEGEWKRELASSSEAAVCLSPIAPNLDFLLHHCTNSGSGQSR